MQVHSGAGRRERGVHLRLVLVRSITFHRCLESRIADTSPIVYDDAAMKLSSAQVKNLMRRGLRQLVDPDVEPADRLKVYVYFDYACAYCAHAIAPNAGDLDHLISAAKGGTNHLSNRVLSCKPCNAEQKRDTDWLEFIRTKTDDPAVLQQRVTKIQDWVRSFGTVRVLPSDVLHLLDEESAKATAAYDAACSAVKAANRIAVVSARQELLRQPDLRPA